MPPLSLDCLTLTDTTPEELILSAYKAGFNLVSLCALPAAVYPKRQLTPSNASRCAELLADTGLAVHAIEAVDIASNEAVLAARPGLDLGVVVGAQSVIAYHHANPDRSEAADALALLAEEAGHRAMSVILEPLAMGHTRTMSQARTLIAEADADVGILFDTYHFMRAGGSAAEIAAIEPTLIRRVQVNDGLIGVGEGDWLAEALGERLYPGKGQFPLLDLLRNLPRNIPWSIESPSLRRMQAGMAPAAQAAEAFVALTAVLNQLGVGSTATGAGE